MTLGGKTFYDREQAGKLRTKALEDIQLVLDDSEEAVAKVENFSKFKKDMLMKLSTNILPRLNEHTGDSGEPINIFVAKEIIDKNDTPRTSKADS